MTSSLPTEKIADLLRPYIADAPFDTDWPRIYAKLAAYLELILKWNAHTNLTAIRTPEEIVRRHFGESLFAGTHLGPAEYLLDFGSGAGFPGVPIQLLRPGLHVMLAESQRKKAAFLGEVTRTLDIPCRISYSRVEEMSSTPAFDTVTLRAVDNMNAAIREAARRAGRQIVILTTPTASPAGLIAGEFEVSQRVPLPESTDGILEILTRRS